MRKPATDVAAELDAAILEMARDARGTGAMSDATYEAVTSRQTGEALPPDPPPLTGDDIRALREVANMSQAVFARWLNLTFDEMSQLERGTKRASGPALVLLDVIRRHGMDPVVDRTQAAGSSGDRA